MLFIVPDGDPAEEKSKEDVASSSGENTETSSSAGDSNSDTSQAETKFKVELDLDDAPFLEEETPAEPEPQAPSAEEEKKEDDGKESFLKRLLKNKKKLIIIGGGSLLLILIAILLLLFLGGGDDTKEEVEEIKQEIEEEVQEEAAPPEPIIFKVQNGTDENPTILPYRFLIDWEPFLVPLKGDEGEIRLLQCNFSIPVDDEDLYEELERKKSTLRDAVFYYLSHRPLGLINTAQAQDAFKRDIISVINERVLSAKLQDILIQDYLVQGP